LEGKTPDYANALHFQRRFLSHFYADIAKLRYKHFPKLSLKDLKYWFTLKETALLSLLLHMVKPEKVKPGRQRSKSFKFRSPNGVGRFFKALAKWQQAAAPLRTICEVTFLRVRRFHGSTSRFSGDV